MAPDPKPRRHRGHRRGVEPAGLKRWRLSHRRKADPQPRHRRWKATHTGPRGGRFFRGPHKRRYDPQPRRSYGRLRSYGGKAESALSRYGMLIGGALAAIFGVWQANQHIVNDLGDKDPWGDYAKIVTGGTLSNGDVRPAEVSHLWAPESKYNLTQLNYLKFKFLGQDSVTGNYIGSAWVIPFWASLIGFILSKLPMVPQRLKRPLGKISTGALVVSTVGALALPGSRSTHAASGGSPQGSTGQLGQMSRALATQTSTSNSRTGQTNEVLYWR